MERTKEQNVDFFEPLDVYDNINPKILELYTGEKRILDIGCGSGALGQKLKQMHPEIVVYGIDLSAEAGKRASMMLDRFFQRDLDRENLPQFDIQFDLVILGDVLEHLKRPDLLLKKIAPTLARNGSIIVSVPNVAYGKIRLALLRGRFPYTQTGILDVSHLRFFTDKTIKAIIRATGYQIIETVYHEGPFRLSLLQKIWYYPLFFGIGEGIKYLVASVMRRDFKIYSLSTIQFIFKIRRSEDVVCS